MKNIFSFWAPGPPSPIKVVRVLCSAVKNQFSILALCSFCLLSSGCILSGGYYYYDDGTVPDFEAFEIKTFNACEKSKARSQGKVDCVQFASNERFFFERDYQQYLEDTRPPRKSMCNRQRGKRRR